MASSYKDEKDLINAVLQPKGQAAGGPDLGKIALPAQLETVRDRIVALRKQMGLSELSPQELALMVAVSSSIDPALDDAYVRFLVRRPDIAQRCFDPSVFKTLGRIANALAAAEQASTPVALAALQGVRDFDGKFSEARQQIAGIAAARPQDEVAPGVLGVSAQTVLGEPINVLELETQNADTRHQRVTRTEDRLGTALDTAQKGAADEARVARLRAAAKQGQVLDVTTTAPRQTHKKPAHQKPAQAKPARPRKPRAKTPHKTKTKKPAPAKPGNGGSA